MRTEGDSWDIQTSVGSTALFVAAARMLGGRADDAPAHDEFAQLFMRAAGGEWVELLEGRLAEHPLLTPDFGVPFQQHQIARTRYFDDYVSAATESGVRQVVILAAGLDSRAYRLAWPDGTVIYELDRPQVLEFKRDTLAEAGRKPRAERHEVAVDLREDWPKTLRDSGFDATAPTAWLVEGLLIYLTPDAQDRLFEAIASLSAPGSRVAIEQMDPLPEESVTAMTEDRDATDAAEWVGMIYNEPRTDSVDWFTARGWTGDRINLTDYISRLGGTPVVDGPHQQSLINLVTACRP
ncbi:class I SAM-dependent methyltransferase [Nocardia aurantiaca]|uniref:S-adenosyl-L-methionine-dependent methyltransferase n=1 Tax=Nocardia aurantiaca TaxID=2675850 RepID=A0A6I3L818_9NOCA|nr:SAM-dependent methyltransferase [Nocardia aurantiaca]